MIKYIIQEIEEACVDNNYMFFMLKIISVSMLKMVKFLFRCNTVSHINDSYVNHRGANVLFAVIPSRLHIADIPEWLQESTVLSATCLADKVSPALTNMDWFLDETPLACENDILYSENDDDTLKQSRQLNLRVTRQHGGKTLVCKTSAHGRVITSQSIVLNISGE